uniref:MLO-like protein n=1 Tax=Lactuca sativa TaxID=4236 RepID=A0A9R1V747_LACSA|nr:hypothetical protein LSAT_V11C600316430 [Lactuca sativa]
MMILYHLIHKSPPIKPTCSACNKDVWPVSEAKDSPNWQKVLGEELTKHLTTCGFKSNHRGRYLLHCGSSPIIFHFLLQDLSFILPLKMRKERPTDKGMSWLVKTQYISPLSTDATRLPFTEEQAKELRERRGNTLLDSHNSRKWKIKDIKVSFEACKSHPIHVTNKKLHPVEIFPLFPDFERNKHLQKDHDIFGDVDELLRQRKLGLERITRYDDSGEGKERRLEDEFERTQIGWTGDLRKVVKHIRSRSLGVPFFTTGKSLGANMMVKYLGANGDNILIDGAVAICCPWDLLIVLLLGAKLQVIITKMWLGIQERGEVVKGPLVEPTTYASWNNLSQVHEPSSVRVMAIFMPPPPAATYLAFHPQDNNIIAIGMEDTTIQICNVRVDDDLEFLFLCLSLHTHGSTFTIDHDPPGTGKPQTILGLLSAILHTN